MGFGAEDVSKTKYTGMVYLPDDASAPLPITLSKTRGRKLKKPHHKNSWYPEETKIEAATLWAATRNIKTVCELTDITPHTLNKWRGEPWFQNVVARCVKDKNDELDQAITEIMHKATQMLQDRLENGNVQVNYRTGQQFTVPLNSRDLVMTMGILFDKRQLIRGEATSRTESTTSAQRLEELKTAFLQFSEATEVEGEVVQLTDVGIEIPTDETNS
jgi:hypothetical protein